LKLILESKEQLSDFVMNLSHEFRTPLSVMLLELDLAMKETAENPGISHPLKKSLHNIKRNSLRITKNVNDLIDMINAMLGELRPHITFFDAVKSTNAIMASAKAVLKTRRLSFINHISDNALFIEADEALFQRAILNLLSNSIKNSGADKVVQVSLDSSETDITLSFKDEGESITTLKGADGFEIKLPDASNLARSSEGLGTELFLVKTIVKMQKGRVRLRTRGGGNIFSFSLPIKSPIEQDTFFIGNSLDIKDRVQMELADILCDT
jgi:signal transduction histidine kinase